MWERGTWIERKLEEEYEKTNRHRLFFLSRLMMPVRARFSAHTTCLVHFLQISATTG